MRKLITANFFRFRKDQFSWFVVGIIVVLSLVNVFNSARSYEVMAASGYIRSLDDYYFNQAPLIGVCEVALELLPTGQALLLSDVAIEYPVRAIALSVVFTTVTLLVGSMLFRRKDIK